MVMRRLIWIIYCLGCQGMVLAGEKPPADFSLHAPPARKVQEKEFSDPFADENTNKSADKKIADPLEPMNRAFFNFNDKLYYWVLKPVAKGYNHVAPQPIRVGINRFFNHVKYPVRLVNNLLQLKFKKAGMETARFVVNSTIGLAGFLDPAGSELKLDVQTADFDQTLGFYRLPPGIYIHWPIFGPCSVRGTFGAAGDVLLTPWTYIGGVEVSLGVRPYETINSTSLKLGEYEDFKKGALDPYVSLRSAYFENRKSVVRKSKT